MATIVTRPTGEDVTAFLEAVPDERRRADGHALRTLFERVTGAGTRPGLITAPTGISPARVPDAGTDPAEISAAPTTC